MNTNYSSMEPEHIPVIFVHGWNSHPGAWNQLGSVLDARGILSARFDHSTLANARLHTIAAELQGFMNTWRRDTGYTGPVDMVCHSVGTCIARYYLEVCDGLTKREKVRQLIGLGPPNNGSALAELFVHPELGPAIIDRLSDIFVPAGFDPEADAIVQDVRPKSPFMERLRAAGTRPDIIYRVIVTANPCGDPAFFPLFEGRTWVMDKEEFCQTLEGDGIVAHTESALPGISLDIIPLCSNEADLPPPSRFCHIGMTKNPLVNERVLFYLTSNCPLEKERTGN